MQAAFPFRRLTQKAAEVRRPAIVATLPVVEASEERGHVAFQNGGDDVVLAEEISVDVADAHLRLGGDLGHTGGMKAVAAKAGLRRFQNLLAATGG